MCDNCKCEEEKTPSYEALRIAVHQQRMMIDAKDAEIEQLRYTIAGIYEWMQKHIEVLEKENQRREASILYMSEAGAA